MKRWLEGIESFARALVWIFGMVLAIITIVTVLPLLGGFSRQILLISLILFLIAATLVFIFDLRHWLSPQPRKLERETSLKKDMKETNDKNKLRKIGEDAQLEHLLKEYELCWQGIEHNNTRLWTSASIFMSGGILALTWLWTRPLIMNGWAEFFTVTIISVVTCLILWLYLRIFGSLEVLDRIEFYRAEEIEKRLKLWRIRYRLRSREQKCSPQEDGERFNAMRKTVSTRLGIKEKDLSKRRGTNKAFRWIIRIIILASLISIAKALIITLGLLCPI